MLIKMQSNSNSSEASGSKSTLNAARSTAVCDANIRTDLQIKSIPYHSKQSTIFDSTSCERRIVRSWDQKLWSETNDFDLKSNQPQTGIKELLGDGNSQQQIKQHCDRDGIPRTLSTIESSSEQLNSQTFVTTQCPIWRGESSLSVTENHCVKKPTDRGKCKRFAANANFSPVLILLEGEKIIDTGEENTVSKKEAIEEISNVSELHGCHFEKSQKDNFSSVENQLRATNLKATITKPGKNQNQSYESQKNKQQNNNSVRKSLYAKKKSGPLNKFYSGYLKDSNLLKSPRDLHYRSAFDLSRSGVGKADSTNLNRDTDAPPSSYIQKKQKQLCSIDLHTPENRVSKDKKRLCKSLSNLTAEDVLSIPCSSIFNQRTSSTYQLQKSPRLARAKHVANDIGKQTSSSNKEKKVLLDDTMLKNIKSSSGTQNSPNIKTPTPSAKKSSEKEVLEHSSPKATGKKMREIQDKNESKSTKKTPKLTKSLIPFMRKNRKQENSTTEQHIKPMKAQEAQNRVERGNNIMQNNTAKKNSNSHVEDKLEDYNGQAHPDITGFKKIKVPAKQAQRNVHSTYAARVARVRNEASRSPHSGSTETSPDVANSRDPSLSGKHDKVVIRKKPILKPHSSRHSADLSGSTDSLIARPLRRRPLSLAAPAKDTSHRHSGYSKSSFNLNCLTTPTTTATNDAFSSEKPSFAEKECVSNETSVATVTYDDEPINRSRRNSKFGISTSDVSTTKRGSVNLSDASCELSTSRSTQAIDINRNGSTSSFNSSTPLSSSALASNYLSVTRGSLASSFGSVFEENLLEKLETMGVETLEEEELFPVAGLEKLNTVGQVQRSKSLCRRGTAPSTLAIELSDRRRSISPSFNNVKFKHIVSQPNIVSTKPPSHPSSRNASFQDLVSQRRPSKPTTPKPKKLSSSSSFTSLNKLSFQLTSQSQLSPSEKEDHSKPHDVAIAPEVILRHTDGRTRASAKNAQIRRRMSLQLLKSRNSDVIEDTRRIQEFEVFKRHSISTLDRERMKTAMVQWGVASSSGSNIKYLRKKARPLSEIQHSRREVHAIPEHKEIVHVAPIISSQHMAATSVLNLACDFPKGGAVYRGILGTCFSEEDIPTARDEVLWNSICRPELKSPVFSPLSHNLKESIRGQGSTVSESSSVR